VSTAAIPQFQNIEARLPPVVRRKLLSNEPALAYVMAPGGCGSAPGELLVTDSRVILRGQNLTRTKSGCGNAPSQSLEIPINHISSVSEDVVKTGCGGTKRGIGINSGTARQVIRIGNPKELEGALRILQALIRAVGTRR
jgi:hypothetical protein